MTYTCVTTALIATKTTDASATNVSAARAKSSFSELQAAMQCSSGATSLTTAPTNALATAKPASTVLSSATRVSTYQANSFAKRMQLLMRFGLIAGITPTSTAKRSPQGTLDSAFSPLGGSDAAEPKAVFSCSKEFAMNSLGIAIPATGGEGVSNG